MRKLLNSKGLLTGLVASLVVVVIATITLAQTTRLTSAGRIFTGKVCVEPTFQSAASLCLSAGAGAAKAHIETPGATADIVGTKTLSSGAGTVTFAQAYAAAPVCVCTDQTGANAVKCSTSTTAITMAGTTSDVIAYWCSGNPN